MKKKIGFVLKRVVFSFLMLYAFNYFLSSLQIYIPINFITVFIVSLLGFPGIGAFIILFFIVK